MRCVQRGNTFLLNIHTGVPQGSILDPLLFSIYINDLLLFINQLNVIMYADDTILYGNKEDYESFESVVNDNLKIEQLV